jgi:16S rRNA (uracil1498-N3)-methyltransferase
MRRFFLAPGCLAGATITLTGPEARHLAVVLRLGPGAAVEFFDGLGQVYTAELTAVGKHQVVATVTTVRQTTETWSPSPLTVAQALLKGKKMDLLIQKATELGVHAFVPIISKHCENHGQRDNQHERWQRIMIEACKQCQRTEPMQIQPVTALADLVCRNVVHRLAAWEGERSQGLPADLSARPGPICLFLGPEGGLHVDDLRLLREQQFTTVSLGRLILRGETATLAAIAIIQYQTGVLRPAPDQIAGPPAQAA